MKARISYIDAAKGIGMLLIVLGHVSTSWGCVSNWASYFKISIFFIISGYLQSISSKELCIGKKAHALLIPYVVYSVFCLLFSLGICLMKNDGFYNAGIQFLNFVTLRGISTLWFLPSLFIAILLHKYLLLIKWLRFILLIAIPIVFVLFNNCLWLNFDSELTIKYFSYCLFLVFLKGIVAYWFYEIAFCTLHRILDDQNKIIKVVISLLSLVVCFLISYLIKDSQINFNYMGLGVYPILFFVFGIVISYNVIYLLKIIPFQSRILQFVGNNSLFIMCTHLPFYIVFLSRHLVKNLIANVDFVQLIGDTGIVLITLFIVMIIETIMIYVWKKMKQLFMDRLSRPHQVS